MTIKKGLRLLAMTGFLLAGISTYAHAAQAPGGLGKDSDKPIEVNADSLEVLQDQNQAIFRGNVLAIQGDVRLKSDVMTVYYAKKTEGAKPAGAAEQSQSIEKIDVEGNVFLSTPEETGSGERGTYDVAKKEVRLNENVTLTRENNVLKGEALVYNLQTGHSVLVGNTVAGRPAPDGKAPARVRGVFMPKEEAKP